MGTRASKSTGVIALWVSGCALQFKMAAMLEVCRSDTESLVDELGDSSSDEEDQKTNAIEYIWYRVSC